MQNAAVQRVVKPLPEEVAETKKSPDLHEVEEQLSEFERARRYSKTWSMPHDQAQLGYPISIIHRFEELGTVIYASIFFLPKFFIFC